MLSLADFAQAVKGANLEANPQAIAGQTNQTANSQAYREFKSLGWTSALEVHPIDRVAVLRLQRCAVWLNTAPNATGWRLERPDGTIEAVTSSTAEITALAMDALPPAPLSPVEEVGMELMAELGGDLGGRLLRAIELVKAGTVEFAEYGTGSESAGVGMFRFCNCPDATHRPQFTEWGGGCKHILAQEIADRLRVAIDVVAQRKLADKWETLHMMVEAAQDEAEAYYDEWDCGVGAHFHGASFAEQMVRY